MFKVKWTGHDKPTWEPEANLEGAANMLAAFRAGANDSWNARNTFAPLTDIAK